MITTSAALSTIPVGLRDPLIAEFRSIVQNFLEHRWLPSELSGGRFSEIVYTILDGHAKGSYASKPSKPSNFPEACKKLENNAGVPRSFKALIPRMLPALYEIRNNRSVGHVGGDVDPNHMDSVAVLSMSTWVMAELVRVLHNLTISDAQKLVEALSEVRLPIVWSDGSVKRVLRPEMKLVDQLLLLISTAVPEAKLGELVAWTEFEQKYVVRTLRGLHAKRFVEFDEKSGKVKILPPGAVLVQKILRDRGLTGIE